MKDVRFFYRISYYDVMRDAEGGWVGNYSIHDRRLLGVTDPDASDTKLERAARAVFGFTGRKTIREEIGPDHVRWIDPSTATAVEIDYSEEIT